MSNAPKLLPTKVLRKYQRLRKRYASDHTYRVVVDMYRNHPETPEPIIAAHFMAEHDLATYSVANRGEQTFAPVKAGYSDRELAFLLERGVKPL
jgi:hypothetical protein